MKVAIVYDWVNQIGGAERVLLSLNKIWPKAPLYTSVFDHKKAPWAKEFPSVKTTFLQKIPLLRKSYRLSAPLTPLAFETFNFDDFDLVISVTSGPAKAIITKPQTCHICYCLTPPRYFWEKRFLKSKWLFPFLAPFRAKDYLFSKRPDYFLTTSKNVSRRIEKFYHLKAEVVHPGVNLERFTLSKKREPFFLLVSRLVSYKKTDLAIKAFNKLGWKLKIVGSGRELKSLKRIARKNISFLGEISDEKLIGEYQSCQALIVPQEEDFGLTSIEAQACGKPVIAFSKGGSKETVIPGVTGELFFPQTKEGLIKKLKSFNSKKYLPEDCRKNAENFSEKQFMLLFEKKAKEYFQKYQREIKNGK